MTAEVAILNKGAIVLAADSAVTISSGSSQHKTFDSADKLFELSCHNHIAIMVNGDLDFAEAPLSVLIKKFRNKCGPHKSVRSISNEFLKFLSEFGKKSPIEVQDFEIRSAVAEILSEIDKRASHDLQTGVEDPHFFDGCDTTDQMRSRITELRSGAYRKNLNNFREYISGFPDAKFVGVSKPTIRVRDKEIVAREVDRIIPNLDNELKQIAVELGCEVLRKAAFGASNTGLIIAGFGSNELFPTLISVSIYGIVSGHLKYFEQEYVDIDRSGPKAKVVAFAQREMVDRFLFGIDSEVQRNIRQFSRSAITAIRESIFELIDPTGEGLESLELAAKRAEDAFVDGLEARGFAAMRAESEAEIEDMVEFMPKAEMARMAEALVNLTSIKRRVSRGMETVGGPIDVAVISHSDGLVWVKRKHYFPSELNSRFFERKKSEVATTRGQADGDA